MIGYVMVGTNNLNDAITFYDKVLDVIGLDRKIAVVREISKIYEEVFRGTLEEAIQEFTNKVIKGEFVICIDKVE